MIDEELIQKVRYIEIRTKGLVNSVFGGEYHSAFKGKGMSFSEVRPYEYGDDIRKIDWNVTARTNEPYIKIFEEERELTIMLCVDISSSEKFGSGKKSKHDYLIEICALLSFSAIKNNDKVGMVLFSDHIEKTIPPKKGRTHVLRLIRDLYTTHPIGLGTRIGDAVTYINRLLNRRSIVILATDMLDNHDYKKAFKITRQKHDFIVLYIHDPLEMKLAKMGILPLYDGEKGIIRFIDSSSKKVREEFMQRKKRHHDNIKNFFYKNQIDYIDLNTHESFVEPLLTFFRRRHEKK